MIKEELDKLAQAGKGKIAVGFGGNPKDTNGSAVRGVPAFELLFNINTYLKKKGLSDNFELTFLARMAEPGKRMGEKALVSLCKPFKHYLIRNRWE